jgi:MinD superfamily P-loop ATPase
MDIAAVILNPESGWEQNIATLRLNTENLNIPIGVILNKVKQGNSFSHEIEAYCMNHSIPLLGIIPFSNNLEDDTDAGLKEFDQEFTQVSKGLLKMVPEQA